MNNRATRTTLFTEEKPPLINLSDNRPHVDPTFRNFEHQNSPFINGMVMPLYTKTLDGEYVFDNSGSRYSITDSQLYKDGKVITDVDPFMFKREEVTIDYYDFDYYNSKLFSVIKNSDNSFNINGHTTESLYTIGHILAHRIVALSEQLAAFVVVYNTNNTRMVTIYSIRGETVTSVTRTCEFYRQECRLTSTNSFKSSIKSLRSNVGEYNVTDPIINIALLSDSVIGVSVVNTYGRVLDTKYNGFATYLLTNNSIKQIGVDIWPTDDSTVEQVTTTEQTAIRISRGRSSATNYQYAVTTDGITFYSYTSGNKGEELELPSTVLPTNTGESVTIGGVDYTIYRISKLAYTYTMTATVLSTSTSPDPTWSFKATTALGVPMSSDSNSDRQKTISYTYEYWSGSEARSATAAWKADYSVDIYDTTTVNSEYNVGLVYEHSTSSSSTVTALVYPTIVADNGRMYSFYGFPQNTTAWTYINNKGSRLVESGTFNNISGDRYSVSAVETHVISTADIIRSNSFVLNQNLIQSTVRLCTNGCATPASSSNDSNSSAVYTEYTNSNSYPLTYSPGTSTYSNYNYYGEHVSQTRTSGKSEDFLAFTVVGMRVPIKNGSNFNLLYNTLLDGSCLIYGVSYSADDAHMGTLLTPLTSIDDDTYIVAGDNFFIYKDKSNRWFKVSIVQGNELKTLFDDRYILINTTSYLNMYDSVTGQLLHYATDYNNRLLYGTSTPYNWVGYNSGVVSRWARYTANGINPAFQIMPRIAIASPIYPAVQRVRVDVTNIELPHCLVDESTQGIDVYYSNITSTANNYRFTIDPYQIPSRYLKFDLDGSSYTVTSSSYISPNIFTEYINGAGNNDMVNETYDTYSLVYYEQQPYFLYTLNSQVNNVASSVVNSSSEIPYRASAFFCIQGQFYACINNKLYSCLYNSGVIASMESIIDINGLYFIGNNPQIAFFYSPTLRAIYSFTGDAILEHIYDASKLTGVFGNYWYDESTQSIFIATSDGLLVMGPKNTYLIEDWNSVTNMQFSSDNMSHVTNNGHTINFVYYPLEGYEPKAIDIQTSFYGLGDSSSTTIDRWNITLYDQSKTHPSTTAHVCIRSITDVVTTAEEKSIKITPDMYDKWSHSVLLSYTPKLIKGQGLRLELISDLSIQSIIPHVQYNNSGTLTKYSN